MKSTAFKARQAKRFSFSSHHYDPASGVATLTYSVDGQVLNSFGEAIPGLFAAGRTTAGLPTAPYIASGLSVGDCTFFGRRAGRTAAVEGKA